MGCVSRKAEQPGVFTGLLPQNLTALNFATNKCSGCPESVFTMDWNQCSGWIGIRTMGAEESVRWAVRFLR